MKLSVSLTDEDVAAIDDYARMNGLPSRSAVVQRAVRGLRHAALQQEYGAAFDEWRESGDAELWNPTAGDGL